MKPEPSPWRCGVSYSPRGTGAPKRRKNSSTGSSAPSRDSPLMRLGFWTAEMLTTAGPTCSTSVAKSGSTRPLSVPTGCGEDGGCACAVTGADCDSACAAATEDWGEQAPTVKARMATPARRRATNSDISTIPLVCWPLGRIVVSDRPDLAKFSGVEFMVPPRSSMLCVPTPQIGAEPGEYKGQTHHGPVPDAGIGRQARARLHFGAHYVRVVLRRP